MTREKIKPGFGSKGVVKEARNSKRCKEQKPSKNSLFVAERMQLYQTAVGTEYLDEMVSKSNFVRQNGYRNLAKKNITRPPVNAKQAGHVNFVLKPIMAVSNTSFNKNQQMTNAPLTASHLSKLIVSSMPKQRYATSTL